MGIFSLISTKKTNNSIGIKGVLKKISYFAIIIISVIVENIFELGTTLKTAVVYSLMLTEIVSILKHCKNIGIKNIPIVLTNVLEVFKSKTNIDEESKETKNTKDK